MEKRPFRFLVYIMVVGALVLSACGTTETTPTTPPEPVETTAPEVGDVTEPEPGEPGETTITFWHAMSGSRGDVVNGMVQRFNESNPNITVEAEYSGSYAETLTGALAAYRTGNAPTIVQVYEVGTRTMLDSDAIVPVYTLNQGDVDWSVVVDPIRKYYSVDGELYCMPFNSSTAMVYYNKDMLEEAGLDPNDPPETWTEVEEYSQQVMDAGLAEGGISMGWPAWIFEQTFATHDQLFANNDNGRSGLADEVLFNSDFGVMVMEKWQEMAENGTHVYGGREYSANDPFLARQFPFLVQSTSSLGGILRSAEFEVGTAFLPRFEGGFAQGNSVVGGGCLWVFDTATPEQQQAAWEFFKHTFSVEESITWHKETGYFPTSVTAYEQLQEEGWFEEEPNHSTAFDQILTGADTPASNGVLLGNFVEIRDIVGAMIEDVVVNGIEPQTALDEAAAQANQVLADYVELHGQ